LAATSPSGCAGHCIWASRRPSEWCGPTRRSTSRRWRRATSFPRASRTRWRWSV
jgi:hypothetical protein